MRRIPCKPIDYRGHQFLIKQYAGRWHVDIGCDDIWEPAGKNRAAAIGYAKTVIDSMVDEESSLVVS